MQFQALIFEQAEFVLQISHILGVYGAILDLIGLVRRVKIDVQIPFHLSISSDLFSWLETFETSICAFSEGQNWLVILDQVL